jgi:hypothetical protein
MGQVAAGATWVKIVDDWFSPESGRVEQHEEGAPADVVLYDADPRDDPEVLERPALVMVGGEVLAKRGPSA